MSDVIWVVCTIFVTVAAFGFGITALLGHQWARMPTAVSAALAIVGWAMILWTVKRMASM